MANLDVALSVKGLTKKFDISAPFLNRIVERKLKRYLCAVDEISFEVPKGGCVSLVDRKSVV